RRPRDQAGLVAGWAAPADRRKRQLLPSRRLSEHRHDPSRRDRLSIPDAVPGRRRQRVRRLLLAQRPVDRLPPRGSRQLCPLQDARRRKQPPRNPRLLELPTTQHRLGPTRAERLGRGRRVTNTSLPRASAVLHTPLAAPRLLLLP